MFTVRATKKLLARLKVEPTGDDLEPTTRLGDWYANLLFAPGGQLVLFVNERSLLSVLIPAKPAATVLSRFQQAVPGVLAGIEVTDSAIAGEQEAMAVVRVGHTRNRRVLGTMNDFAAMLDAYLGESSSLQAVALRFAEVPCGPLSMGFPAVVARRLLGVAP
jgi:hypothetical protein